jgi:hypothetical protein
MPAPASGFCLVQGAGRALYPEKMRPAPQKGRILGRRGPATDIFSKNGLQIAAGFVIIF